jgi:hypothetical protein
MRYYQPTLELYFAEKPHNLEKHVIDYISSHYTKRIVPFADLEPASCLLTKTRVAVVNIGVATGRRALVELLHSFSSNLVIAVHATRVDSRTYLQFAVAHEVIVVHGPLEKFETCKELRTWFRKSAARKVALRLSHALKQVLTRLMPRNAGQVDDEFTRWNFDFVIPRAAPVYGFRDDCSLALLAEHFLKLSNVITEEQSLHENLVTEILVIFFICETIDFDLSEFLWSTRYVAKSKLVQTT